MNNMSQNQNNPSGILGLVIVDGVGFKNFVLSNFISQALLEFERVIIYSGLPIEAFEIIQNDKIEIVELPIFIESGFTWFWRKMKEVAHMQQHKEGFFGIAANLKKNKSRGKSRRDKLISIIFKITTVLNSEKCIGFYYKMQLKSAKNNPIFKVYQDKLSANKCEILFFTHQRPPYLAILDSAAKKLGIKTCSFIFSWDNLPSKGRMAAPFDSFLVWSELMKTELEYFYPDTKNKTIAVVGTPQFEPYVMQEYYSSKESFFKKFNLNHDFKTIFYSCGDVSTSKNDGLYIEIIAQAILDKEIYDVNFIVRTSPAEDGSRFKNIKKHFPFITWDFPHWKNMRIDHPEPWSQRVPFKDDLVDLRALLQYSDLNVNMCSTMSLDFMIFGKPVINPVFGNRINGLYNDQKYLHYAHYERVVESGAVAIAKDKQQLIEEIKHSLKNPLARILQQKELLNLQIGGPLQDTSARIVKTLRCN